MAEADAATRAYLGVIDAIAAAGIGRNISLKLTQLGLTVDRATCVDNLRRILDAAAAHEFFVRIDMENSPYTQVTLDIFETMWQQGYRNAGVVLQSYLPRSAGRRAADERARRAGAAGERRLQGADEASPTRRRPTWTRRSSRSCSCCSTEGTYPAIATHDPAMIAATRAFRGAARHRRRSLRVPDAVRHPPRPAGAAARRRVSRARLRPVRPRMVPLLHAPAGRTAGEYRFCARKSARANDKQSASARVVGLAHGASRRLPPRSPSVDALPHRRRLHISAHPLVSLLTEQRRYGTSRWSVAHLLIFLSLRTPAETAERAPASNQVREGREMRSMVTNYPQQLAATRNGTPGQHVERHGVARGRPVRPDVLRASRPRLGAALRGQARDDAVHVVRARHARVGDQRTRAAAALRRRRPPPPARDASGWSLRKTA